MTRIFGGIAVAPFKFFHEILRAIATGEAQAVVAAGVFMIHLPDLGEQVGGGRRKIWKRHIVEIR